MYRFQAVIHARPKATASDPPEPVDGHVCQPLRVHPEMLQVPLPVSFEQAAIELAALPRMFVEPDGSLVWVGADGDETWQVDGVLYDRNGRLLYVELKGSCPRNEFDRLLRTFGWPKTPLMFQLVDKAVYLIESDFRRWAEGSRQ
jgi:hypothetical protein